MRSKKLCLIEKLVALACQYEFRDGEVIKEITNYNSNGKYYVSNCGKVFSLHYNQWRLVKQSKEKDGYLFVSLHHNAHRTHKGVHQLVAECFLSNPTPTAKMQIHHIDFNPLNNNACNLMYVSPKEHRAIHDKHNKELAEMRLNGNAERENS